MKAVQQFKLIVIGLAVIATVGPRGQAQDVRTAVYERIGDTDGTVQLASGTVKLATNHWDEPVVSGCDPCLSCCEEICHQPVWTATADALFLDRRNPNSTVLAVNTANAAENLNAADFHFSIHAGFDVSLVRNFGCDNAIELRYFGIDHWHASANAATTNGDLLRVNAAVPIFTFAGDAIDADYASQLHNAEINARHHLTHWLDLLAGFRYLELDERLSASLVNSAVPFDYNTATRNRMYGFQLGGQAWLWNNGAFSLDAIGKAGIYSNQAAQDSTISTGVVTLPANGRGDRTAFVGEIGVGGAVQLTDCLALRGGYRLLWLDGVAVASDQLGASDFANGTGFNGAGEVFYHGAFAGIELVH